MSLFEEPIFDEEKWYDQVRGQDKRLLYASHFEDGRFFNPWLEKSFNVRFIANSYKYVGSSRLRLPEDFIYNGVYSESFPTNNECDKCISFLGHASFYIAIDGKQVLLDPFFSNYAAVAKKSVNINFNYNYLNKPIVLITHNHYDHLDKYTVQELISRDATFIVPLNLKEYFLRLGASDVHELDWWENIKIGDLKFTFLPAQHWSFRFGQLTNTTLWGSFMLEASKTIYLSGDTGYFIGYEEFGDKYDIDYAVLPVGASYPRWQKHYQHQNATDFFRAVEDLNAKYTIPMHYGVMELGKESVNYPVFEILDTLKTRQELVDKVKILKICECLKIV